MKTRILSLLGHGATAALLACLAGTASAQSFCVYDPLGAQGDYSTLFKDYQLASKRWNVVLDIRLYTDDEKLNDAFKSGQCDMASMIGMRARSFNAFTGTIDAPSAVENYQEMRTVMNAVASPKMAKYMQSGPYEVVGVIPVGAAYAVVDDRSINSVEMAAGKKAGIMGWDKPQILVADDFHIIPVKTDLTHYGTLFNSGAVDIVVAPMVLYRPLELYKGIGSKGGIIRRPLFNFTMQVVAYKDRFPPGFAQQSRDFMNAQVDHALGLIRNNEADVDSHLWIYATRQQVKEWNKACRATLDHLTREGYYDQHMLAVLQRVRCTSEPDGVGCDAAAATPAATPVKVQ
jgi:hypothetical protein